MDIGIIILYLVTDLSEPLDQIYDSNLFPGLVVDAGKV
jgi:hypothetical protein